MTPILKWLGGKGKVMPMLSPLVPWGRFTRVFEPFLGGGAFFFSLDREEIQTIILSDANRDLIRFYKTVASSASAVATNAVAFSSRHSAESYLRARALFNELRAFENAPTGAMDELHAGLFLYLNKAGFNGLYRVNEKTGDFNVAPNAKSSWNPTQLELCGQLCPAMTPLRRATLFHGRFSDTFVRFPPGKGDFLFCDPPYVPDPSGKGFTAYTSDGFNALSLEYLKKCLDAASKRGALSMVTHRDTPFVRELFRDYNVSEYMAPRRVSVDGTGRQPVKELCIRNYE